MNRKPLGHKNYGHIARLPGSRMGPADHKCHEGQARIACVKKRDRHDKIIVQEKLDGSNVGVARIDNRLYPLTRAGYSANTSPYEQHHRFSEWVIINSDRFMSVLKNGERLCGEWLLVPHGTIYKLRHEPFVAFDLFKSRHNRLPFDDFMSRVGTKFKMPSIISYGDPCSIEKALNILGKYGFHGAQEQVEGAVWRVEKNVLNDKDLGNAGGRHYEVDFLVKYVRPDKIDGKYL